MGSSRTAGHRGLLQFLGLCARSGESLVPSPCVDAEWHRLLECSSAYRRWCEDKFGMLIEHHPSAGIDERLYAQTFEMVVDAYGPPDSAVWPQPGSLHKSDLRCMGKAVDPQRSGSFAKR